jgi:glycosyltransferase involved in cell wall biosynthesis
MPILLGKIIIGAFRADVISIHLCDVPFAYLGLFVLLVSRLARKPLIVRKFGGNLFSLGMTGNWAAYYVMRHANAALLQTQSLMNDAKARGMSNVLWYPTSRPQPKDLSSDRRGKRECRRFVFVGHVCPEKGVQEILIAAEGLPDEITVDVYGPFMGGLSERTFAGSKSVRYRGVIPPEEVITTLSDYDALLLPTHYLGEGYPGVVIEAYHAGLPVICTHWQALPEIVDDTSGILVEPRNAEALYRAMKRLSEDSELYARLCKGAIEQAGQFSTEHWADEFVKICRKLVEE